jgi:hypothetical protein
LSTTERRYPQTVLASSAADKPDLPRLNSRHTHAVQPPGISSSVIPQEVAMRFRHHHRLATAALALAACAALAAPVAAEPGSDYPQPSAAKIGDTPADFGQPVAAPARGDTPVDHPGSSRAVAWQEPATIEVVRPERTIVRDVDELLPLVFSSAALVIVLGGAGFLLLGGFRQGRVGRSH